MNLFFLTKSACGAVDQLLNNNFFQNPAELNLIKQRQLIIGNVFIAPALKFTGTTVSGSGIVRSKVNDSLPYLLTAYRFTDRFVIGLNITPSGYGHLDWPVDSIVAAQSTITRLFYYRIGAQSSYQLTDNLAIGGGFNLHYNKREELDFVILNKGNQINKVNGINYSGDVGLYYKLTPRNYLTMMIYTPVNTFGYGTSSLGPTTVNNFALNIREAAVAAIGLQHPINNKWFLEEKIYWSGWSIEKEINFINTTTGNTTIPAKWRDTWSFQGITRYVTTDNTALLGAIIYETNAAPISTNAIGYPLAAFGSISAGLDLTLKKALSTQLVYSYGRFLPKAKIANALSYGSISAKTQAGVLQFTYKV
ncbi:OmpP1/FadL family transporter [Legionella fairfieldensis]|uniref:OmpP1/FadL family transporter n=1 Tax=Legionella fairfieldensis TaxID=45064 RepID=UPI00048F4116|nr:outer membrane protein transport protein [Legionella fairfieldensis]